MRNSKEIHEEIITLQNKINILTSQIHVIDGKTQSPISLRVGDHVINVSESNHYTGWKTVVRFEYRDLARHIRNGLADDRRSMCNSLRDLRLEMAKALRKEADEMIIMAEKMLGVAK